MAGKTQHVRAVRAFRWQQREVPVGAVIEVPTAIAVELRSSNKAVRAEAPAKPEPKPEPASTTLKLPPKPDAKGVAT